MPFFHPKSPRLRLLPLRRILPSPWPLRFESEAARSAMVRSLRCTGLIQPPVVRKVGRNYELIAGARRLEAAKSLGWDRIPALVVRADSTAAVDMAMAENLARLDLTRAEEEAARQRLAALLERSLRESVAFAQSLPQAPAGGRPSDPSPAGQPRGGREVPQGRCAPDPAKAMGGAPSPCHRATTAPDAPYRRGREETLPNKAEASVLAGAAEGDRSREARLGSAVAYRDNGSLRAVGAPLGHGAEAGQGPRGSVRGRESAEEAGFFRREERGKYRTEFGRPSPKPAHVRRKTPVFPEDPDLFSPSEAGEQGSALPPNAPLPPTASKGRSALPPTENNACGETPLRRGVVRESALFLRSAHRLLQGLKESGLGPDSACTEEDDHYFYTLRIPK